MNRSDDGMSQRIALLRSRLTSDAVTPQSRCDIRTVSSEKQNNTSTDTGLLKSKLSAGDSERIALLRSRLSRSSQKSNDNDSDSDRFVSQRPQTDAAAKLRARLEAVKRSRTIED